MMSPRGIRGMRAQRWTRTQSRAPFVLFFGGFRFPYKSLLKLKGHPVSSWVTPPKISCAHRVETWGFKGVLIQ